MGKYKIIETEGGIVTDKINRNLVLSIISDLHYTKNSDKNMLLEVRDVISDNKPNYICIPGDLIDDSSLSDKELRFVDFFLNGLTKIAPVIIGVGNHDFMKKNKEGHWEYFNNSEYFDMISNIENVYLLDDKSVDFNLDGISFSGHTLPFDYYEGNRESNESFNKAMRDNDFLNIMSTMNSNNFDISLIHSPTNAMSEENMKKFSEYTDLILSGHMHGGVVPTLFENLFKDKGIISPVKKLFPNHVRGFINHKDVSATGFVSTGINKFDILGASNIFKPEVGKIMLLKKGKK